MTDTPIDNKFISDMATELELSLKQENIPIRKQAFLSLTGLSRRDNIDDFDKDDYTKFFHNLASASFRHQGEALSLAEAQKIFIKNLGSQLDGYNSDICVQALLKSSSDEEFINLTDLAFDMVGGHVEHLLAFVKYDIQATEPLEGVEELIRSRFKSEDEEIGWMHEKGYSFRYQAQRLFRRIHTVPVRVSGRFVRSDGEYFLIDILGVDEWYESVHCKILIRADTDHPDRLELGADYQLHIVGGASLLMRQKEGTDYLPILLENARILPEHEKIDWRDTE